MADLYVSYAPEDADWVRVLAGRLAGYGLNVFFAEWSVLPGDVVVHGLERGLRESAERNRCREPRVGGATAGT